MAGWSMQLPRASCWFYKVQEKVVDVIFTCTVLCAVIVYVFVFESPCCTSSRHAQPRSHRLTVWFACFCSDAALRAEEEAYRSAFVSNPSSMVDAWKQGKLLLDVFHPDVLPTFVYEVSPCQTAVVCSRRMLA